MILPVWNKVWSYVLSCFSIFSFIIGYLDNCIIYVPHLFHLFVSSLLSSCFILLRRRILLGVLGKGNIITLLYSELIMRGFLPSRCGPQTIAVERMMLNTILKHVSCIMLYIPCLQSDTEDTVVKDCVDWRKWKKMLLACFHTKSTCT